MQTVSESITQFEAISQVDSSSTSSSASHSRSSSAEMTKDNTNTNINNSEWRYPNPYPKHMRAVIMNGYGNPTDVLHVSLAPVIQPCADEILVQVFATSVNPADVKVVNGNLKLIMPLTFPYTPGYDVAGRVSAVGNG